MRVSIASDHRGVDLKSRVVELLRRLGHDVSDEGTHDATSVDYPDYAAIVGGKVAATQVDRGILICGTGVGMSIAANRFPGVRAATCPDEFYAEMCRRHNDVNVLCLSGDLIGESQVDRLVKLWLETPFEGGRHARRIEKIEAISGRRCE